MYNNPIQYSPIFTILFILFNSTDPSIDNILILAPLVITQENQSHPAPFIGSVSVLLCVTFFPFLGSVVTSCRYFVQTTTIA